jgi:DNA helicase HerA-like ATPase
MASLLAGFDHWLRCLGQADALWAPAPPDGVHREGGRGSFDDHAAHLQQPFAWLVVATPLAPDVLENDLAQLATKIPRLRQRENSELDRIELVRAQARYRELTKARASGMWSVRVLVGGQTPAAAHFAASLLCSASDLDQLPYILTPDNTPCLLPDGFTPAPESSGAPQSPFAAPTELLAALARPPARELPGIRLVTPHRFDVTPENAGEPGFALGTILDNAHAPAGTLRVSRSTLNRHTFVCGATGSGKSQTVRSLLETLSRDNDPIPWLVIEPAKAEYARMSGRLDADGSVLVIRPGDDEAVPASLNPLEPALGFPLQSHLDLVRALFLAAFEADEPFPQVLSRALTQCYIRAGWDLVTGEPRPATKPKLFAADPDRPAQPSYPSLRDLQVAAQQIIQDIGYSDKVTADVRGFVDVRIGSLRDGTPGRFFEGGHPLDIERLLATNVVLEIDRVTNDQDKAFLIGAVLVRIVEHLRVQHGTTSSVELRHVIVVEEAHRLLRNIEKAASVGASVAAVELFASLLAEIRAYGEGVVVVEQIPSKILPDVIKNTALKVMHRLPAADDRDAVGATMNLHPHQSENVVSLRPGLAAVSLDGTDRPLLVRMPDDGEARESADGCAIDPPLQGRRSRLCGAECRRTACTLREMNDAAHLSRAPMLVVWIETVVTATVIGLEPPAPSQELAAWLDAVDVRRLQCAAAHSVERASGARRHTLAKYFDLDDFNAHLLGPISPTVVDLDAAQDSGDRWTAGPYRWRELHQALDLGAPEGTIAEDLGPHPDSDRWAARGLDLRGLPRWRQAAHARQLPVWGDTAGVLLGDVRASGLRDAVITLSGSWTPPALESAAHRATTSATLEILLEQVIDLM